MPIEQENFSAQVKTFRKRLKMSQKDLASALGVSFATVNRWENGKTVPSNLALNQLKAFYDQKAAKQK